MFLVWLTLNVFKNRPWGPAWLRPDAILRLAGKRISLMAYALFVLPFLGFDILKFRGEFGYGFPILHLVVLVFVVPFLRKDRLWLSFLFSLLFLAASIFHFPVHPDRSDMLPVIRTGLDQWSSGLSSYQAFQLQGRQNFMSYLPGTMFFHLPAWWAGLDLRWNSILIRAIWMGLVLRMIRGRETWADKNGVTLAMHFFALSPYLGFRHDLYFEGFFLLLVLFFSSPKSRWISWPIAIWTRQWSWMLTPFVLGAQVLRGGAWDMKALARALIGFAGISLVFLFLLRHSTVQQFGHAVFWFQGVIDLPGYSGDYGLTFAPVFFWMGASHALQKLQALLAFLLFGLALLEALRARHVDWLRQAAVCWVVFLMLNPHFWLYFWLSPALFFGLLPFGEEKAENLRNHH